MTTITKTRGRRKTNPAAPKDNRKTYTGERIELEGNVITFDGKYNPDRDELKIYRMHGDVKLFDQAIQNFCIENKIGKAVVTFKY